MPILTLTDPDDDRVADYTRLTDVVLRSKHEPSKGLYIAESSTVIRRAVAAGHRPRSFLMAPRWLDDLADVIDAVGAGPDGEVPVYLAEEDVLERLTGFHLHRGALAAMHRPPLAPVADIVRGARRVAIIEDVVDHPNVGTAFDVSRPPARSRIVVFEDIVDHTNLGAGVRACAALGADGFLVSPRCADPLYRRSIRVSMGTVFQIPWTRMTSWPGQDLQTLRDYGYTIAALGLGPDSVSLADLEGDVPDKLVLVVGTEGDGLRAATISQADLKVQIPMSGGVDSLNVAAALSVALWATRPRSGAIGRHRAVRAEPSRRSQF